MSADVIPVETLMMIFRNLKGTDAVACRAVCRRWRDAVDSLSDDVWEDFCYRDFWNPKATKNASNLSFRDVYKSLTLWSKVEEAEEKCPTKPVGNVTWFKVLKNNKMAVLRNHLSFCIIEYYNIQTMSLISLKTYNFRILCCDENENLIAMMDEDEHIHVIIKSNGKEFVVGDQNSYNNFTMLNTEVYFKNKRDMLNVARLKILDGQETVETEELDYLEEQVVAFANAGDGVNILTDEGNLYCYRNKDLEYCSVISRYRDTDIIYELWDYGFMWSDVNIYRWLSSCYSKEELQITKLKPPAIHTHNHVVLLGLCRGSVHVYKRPYKENGELKLYKAKPDRIIDMNKYSEVDGSKYVHQVDVVETLNGHRLLVLCSLRLFCVDLLHKQLNATPCTKQEERKRARNSARPEPLQHVYMTRSRAKCSCNSKKPRVL